MSYRDPYSGHYAAGSSGQYQPQYSPEPAQDRPSYPTQQPYNNIGEESYNPYATNPQSYGDSRQFEEQDQPDYSYGDNQQSYNDYPPVARQQTQRSTLSRKSKQPSVSVLPVRKEESGFEAGEFTPGTGAPQRARR